jgi:hypothetical protein
MNSGLPSQNTIQFKEKPMFQRNILPPTLLLLVYSLVLSFTLNTKVYVCSSKLAGCLNYMAFQTKDHTFHNNQ